MKAIKIGTHNHLKTIHELRNNHANKILNTAIELIHGTGIVIVDIDQFKLGFIAYMKSYFQNHEVYKYLDTTTLIDWSKLYKLEQTYLEYYQDTSLIDYDIYATTEAQILGYKYAKKLKEIMNEHPLIRQGIKVPLLKLQEYSYDIDPEAILMLK